VTGRAARDGPGRGAARALGDTALLVELDDLPAIWALAEAARGLPGVLDVVPGAETVLVTAAPGTDLAALARAVDALEPGQAAAASDAAEIAIPVRYDGPDLDRVAELTGLSVEEVVEAHTGTAWRVAFAGFAPGFGYLVDGDPRLHVPRRDQPRTRVPTGAVGLAGPFSGVYPRASPGGWQLLGRTDTVLWDAERDPPALLAPGARVRFSRAPADPAPSRVDTNGGRAAPAADQMCPHGAEGAVEVVAAGPLALVQDLGRPGHAAVGVPRSGAADRAALRLANRLVANAEDAAGIEALLGGLAVRAHRFLTVALAGAAAPADVDGTPVGYHAVLTLRAGQTLRLGVPPSGLRTYLAVRGGLAVPATLGSRASDTLSGLGPDPLRAGDVLPVGPQPSRWPVVDVAPVAPPPGGPVTLRARPGPQAGWLADPDALARTAWSVSSESDRVGLRLSGDPPARRDGELPSAGMVRGAVQLPPGGEPVVLLADHPVTGGYPVVAVVLDADVDRAAQLRPGQPVRLVLTRA
jgi:KipI family sensor histidine kinase inhibitor